MSFLKNHESGCNELDLEHPDVTRTLKTGYPYKKRMKLLKEKREKYWDPIEWIKTGGK